LKLAACNRGYVKIISLLERHHETRDMVFNQLISTAESAAMNSAIDAEKLKFLSTIVAMAKISIDTLEKTAPILKDMEEAFAQTESFLRVIK